MYNRSAFSGYNRTPSEYSAIECVRQLGGCGAYWRTRAAYVAEVPDYTEPPPQAAVCGDCDRPGTPSNPLIRGLTGYLHRDRCVEVGGAAGSRKLPLA